MEKMTDNDRQDLSDEQYKFIMDVRDNEIPMQMRPTR